MQPPGDEQDVEDGSDDETGGLSRPNKRAQIVDAARRCFHRNGITATGVDMIAAEADVSKRTLYNHFDSKEDLIAAYVEWRDVLWHEKLDRRLEGVDDLVDRVLAYFDAYFETPVDEDFRGCSLINAAAEIAGDDDRVLAMLQANKDRVHDEISQLVSKAGISDTDEVATAIVLILEGSVAFYGIHRDESGLETAKASARRLLAA